MEVNRRMRLGRRIRELRERLGYTQSALARAVEVSRQNVHDWERDYKRPGIDTLPRLADALCCSIDKLLDHRLVQDELPGLDAPAAPPPEPPVPIRRSRKTASCERRRAPRRAKGAA